MLSLSASSCGVIKPRMMIAYCLKLITIIIITWSYSPISRSWCAQDSIIIIITILIYYHHHHYHHHPHLFLLGSSSSSPSTANTIVFKAMKAYIIVPLQKSLQCLTWHYEGFFTKLFFASRYHIHHHKKWFMLMIIELTVTCR